MNVTTTWGIPLYSLMSRLNNVMVDDIETLGGLRGVASCRNWRGRRLSFMAMWRLIWVLLP